MEKITEGSFNYAITNIRVVYGAIKAASVYQRVDYYEDLVQEGLITFAKIVEEHGPNESSRVLAFQKIKWQTIDFLRCEQKRNSYGHVELNEELVLNYAGVNPDLILQVNAAVAAASPVEQMVFVEHLIKGRRICELTPEYTISKSSLSRAKKNLQAELAPIFSR